MKYVEIKKFMNIGAKQRQKHSEHTYDEMEKINQKNGKQSVN